MEKKGKNKLELAKSRVLPSLKWGYLPLSIFENSELSCFEIIVRFLKDELNLKYREIAELTNRKLGAVSATYLNSQKKIHGKLSVKESLQIPLSIFSERKLSVLESLVSYLLDSKSLSVKEISLALNKNVQTIYTVQRRARQKSNEKNNSKINAKQQ